MFLGSSRPDASGPRDLATSSEVRQITIEAHRAFTFEILRDLLNELSHGPRRQGQRSLLRHRQRDEARSRPARTSSIIAYGPSMV